MGITNAYRPLKRSKSLCRISKQLTFIVTFCNNLHVLINNEDIVSLQSYNKIILPENEFLCMESGSNFVFGLLPITTAPTYIHI